MQRKRCGPREIFSSGLLFLRPFGPKGVESSFQNELNPKDHSGVFWLCFTRARNQAGPSALFRPHISLMLQDKGATLTVETNLKEAQFQENNPQSKTLHLPI